MGDACLFVERPLICTQGQGLLPASALFLSTLSLTLTQVSQRSAYTLLYRDRIEKSYLDQIKDADALVEEVSGFGSRGMRLTFTGLHVC